MTEGMSLRDNPEQQKLRQGSIQGELFLGVRGNLQGVREAEREGKRWARECASL